MAANVRRFCINCGKGYGRQNAGADFVLCPTCSSQLDNRTKNNLTHRWIRGRQATSPDESIFSGQCDPNWPPDFPDKPLR